MINRMIKNDIVRKLTIAGVVITIMLLTTVWLGGCNNTPTLEQYRATAVQDLQNYAMARGQNNFTPENWAVLQGHVTNGVMAINVAQDKIAVRAARDEAKQQIGVVPNKLNMRRRISFEEGYLSGRFVTSAMPSLSAIIRNQDELKFFFQHHNIEWHNNTPIWDRYRVEFFEKSALILFFRGVTGSNIYRFLDNVSIVGNTLELHTVWQIPSSPINMHWLVWSIIVEVDQTDIQDITNIYINNKEIKS